MSRTDPATTHAYEAECQGTQVDSTTQSEKNCYPSVDDEPSNASQRLMSPLRSFLASSTFLSLIAFSIWRMPSFTFDGFFKTASASTR